MSSTDLAWALAALGRPTPGPHAPGVALDGSRSGSGVFGVCLDGVDTVLKVTRGGQGQLEPARRELEVYLTLGPRLPVRTPRLLDHRDTGDAVVLLLVAHRGTDPPGDWDTGSWLRVAQDLARLHEMPPPVGPEWRRPSWLLDGLARPDLGMIERFWSEPGEAALLAPVLDDLTGLAAAITAPTNVLVHGDCHTANLLREDDRIVWVDWQAAGIGSPAEDLAFLSVRSTPEGIDPPRAAMLTAYAEVRGLAVEPLRTAVLAAELAIFLLAWPQFAGFNTAVGNHRVHARVRELARDWVCR